MFTTYPTYDRYRTLRYVEGAVQRGEDVYALQTALASMGLDTGGIDGIAGRKTAAAIRTAQERLGLTVDGMAGAMTQNALAKRLADAARTKNRLPAGLVYGQLMHESSCRLGNYSVQHSHDAPGGPYYDAGVAQHNTRFTSPQDAFAVPGSIDRLGVHLRKHFDQFAGVTGRRRRWELAAGAWNAPAWAKWIARQEGATGIPTNQTAKPTDAQRKTLEAYMKSATAYMTL